MTARKPNIIRTFHIDWHTQRWGKGKMAPAPEYVVIHFTGSGGSGGTAAGTYKDWMTREKSKRANTHYLVDATGVYECVDPKTYGCLYACASIQNEDHWNLFHDSLSCDHIKVAGNRNTINIEACSAKRTPVRHSRDAYMDTDFYFPDATYRNLVSLSAWLLDEFGISVENLIMHHQISGKLCPAMWCNSRAAYEGWYAFKKDVASVLNKPVMASDLPSPGGKGTESGTNATGTIHVSRGTAFYMDPNGIVIGYAVADKDIKYKFVRDGWYYTNEGYVQGGA